MNLGDIGKVLIIIGVVTAGVGVLVTFAGNIPFLGRLPGDIVWKRGDFTVYLPITTSIALSIVLTLAIYIISRLRGR